MGRTARRKDPALRPVQKVEVSTKNLKPRLIAAVVFLVIGAAALGYSLSRFTSAPSGWQEIEADGDTGDTLAGEFSLIYNLGASGVSARKENRQLVPVYTQACQDAYKIFNAGEEFPGVGNLASLNLHPNEPVEVDPALYEALELLQKYGERRIFLGPVFDFYGGIFSCTEEWQTEDFDTLENEELKTLAGRVAAFARDPESVDIRLLGGGQAELAVSEEYLRFAGEQELYTFVDLSFLKNAFAADLIAGRLMDAGFKYGTLTSDDGFGRTLDSVSGTSYSLDLADNGTGMTVVAARLDYQGPMATVSLRDFPVGENWERRYRVMSDGSVRHMYLDMSDGLPADTAGNLTAYSHSLGCAELSLRALPVFLDGADVNELENGILIDNMQITCTDPEARIEEIYRGYTLKKV